MQTSFQYNSCFTESVFVSVSFCRTVNAHATRTQEQTHVMQTVARVNARWRLNELLTPIDCKW